MKRLILPFALMLAATTAQACETVTLGDLKIEHAWSKATIGADRPAVFYVEISNKGATDDALVGISTPAAVYSNENSSRTQYFGIHIANN